MGSTVTAAGMLGWMAESVNGEEFRFVHLRPQASSQKGIWTGRMRAGYGQHFMGTSPLYLLASAAYRLLQYPVFLGSAAMIWGYVSSAVRGLSRYDDPAFRSFLRRYQHQCLLYGKREATRRTNERQAWVWQTAHQEKERAAAEHG